MYQEKYIISEFYDFPIDKNIIKEAEEKNVPIIMSGILQRAGTKNRNGRIYPLNILKREVDKYMVLVRERRAFGECDHPDSAVVTLANVSHVVTEMEWDGDILKGKVELLDTPSGNIIKGLLKSGVKLGISSRGVGSVKSQGDADIVQDDFELIAFDFVSSPSTPGAFMFKEGASKWGLKKLTDKDIKAVKPEEIQNLYGLDKYRRLNDLLKDDFWKK